MGSRPLRWVVAAALASAAPELAAAHHSYAMFDRAKTASVEGVVAKVEWVNPHAFVWVYVRKVGGGHDLYAFETDPVSRLVAEGWTQSSLTAGDKITVEYAPLRDGRPGGSLLRVKLSTGKTLETRASAGRAAAPAAK
jgi:hypothetical protein